ncbi:MAG: hypothetical protein IH607_05575, partial [Firmicutes bacterium]|nr:hypothetical protein [Bacillota bacterium]
MLSFAQFPYQRLDMDDITVRMQRHTVQIAQAQTIGELFMHLIETDHLCKLFESYACISEVGFTNNSYDAFYQAEESFFGSAKPAFELLVQQRDQALCASPHREALQALVGDEFFDIARMKGKTVSEFVLDLMRRDNKLSQMYSDIMSQLTVSVNGEMLTFSMLGPYLNCSDRATRQTYAAAADQALLGISNRIDVMYDEMVQIRHEIAQKTGFANHTDYCLYKHGRTGYGRKELAAFAQRVEQHIVPVVSRMVSAQEERLGHPVMHYDEGTLFPGREVKVEKDPLDAFQRIFTKLSPETKVFFDELRSRKFYDLELREGKTNGAYSNAMPLCAMPYIFETYNATEGAVRTFAHECGHGLNT